MVDNENAAACENRTRQNVHIVIIAWLYITLTMALALSSALAGAAFFAFLGVAPVLLYAALAVRRVRRRREAGATTASVRERDVHRGDDTDAQPDQ